MGQNDRYCLGQIHAGSAADADDHVDLALAVISDHIENILAGQIGQGLVEDGHRQALIRQIIHHCLEVCSGGHALVRHDQTGCAKASGITPQLPALTRAEKHCLWLTYKPQPQGVFQCHQLNSSATVKAMYFCSMNS